MAAGDRANRCQRGFAFDPNRRVPCIGGTVTACAFRHEFTAADYPDFAAPRYPYAAALGSLKIAAGDFADLGIVLNENCLAVEGRARQCLIKRAS